MSRTAASTPEKIWIGIRFLLFGFVGFWLLLFSSISFILAVFEHDQEFLSPFLSLILMGVSALMMLYGVGEWKRWAYLWVFLSIPISLCLLSLIPGTGSDKGLPVIVAGLSAFGSYAGVCAYYARRVRLERHADDGG